MKKNFFLLIIPLLMLCISSCSSDDTEMPVTPNIPDGKSREVVFEIENFKKENGGVLRSSSTEIVEEVKYLNYYIFDSSDNLIETKSYDAQTPPSTLKFSLSKGTYNIYVYASNGKIDRTKLQTTPTDLVMKWIVGVKDLTSFLMRSQSTITINETDVKQNITLKHFYGRLVLAFDDFANMPSNVKSIVPIMLDATESTNASRNLMLTPVGYDEFSSKYISKITEQPIEYTPEGIKYLELMFESYKPLVKKKNEYMALNQNNPLVLYMFPTDNMNTIYLDGQYTILEKINFMLVGFDTEQPTYYNPENVVFSKTISLDFKVTSGKSLKYTGKLFSGDGLSVGIDADWSETIDEKEL